jgi:hypothetical protein
VNASKVKYHQVVEAGRKGAFVTGVVSKLEDEAKSGEGGSFKKMAVPFLRYT